jgi:hypothetical protein
VNDAVSVREKAWIEFAPEGCEGVVGDLCARTPHCNVNISQTAHLHIVRPGRPVPLGVCSEGCANLLLEEDGLQLVERPVRG